MNPNRRLFLKQLGFGTIGAIGLNLAPALTAWADPAKTGKLPRSVPGTEGVDAGKLLEFVNAVEAQNLNLHSLMVLRHGRVIAEGWWAPYAPDLKHTLYSLSKSFTSTAVGMAVAEGRLSVDDKVVSFFKSDVPETIGDNLAAMRVRDLLSMSTGHDKDMTAAVRADGNKNWVRTFLSLSVEHQPGTNFVYNSAATYMLSAIVQKLTGQTLLTYLKPRLFGPLGIEGADWEVDPNGVCVGGWGLRVRTEDIAKFGQLYLQKGVWRGKQLLPEGWVADATKAQIMQPAANEAARNSSDWLQGYGYQFWRCRHDAYRGDGAFGQYCIVLPKQDAVIAITSETGDMQAILNQVWKHVLPAFDEAGTALVDRSAERPLARKLSQLCLPLPTAEVTSPLAATVSGQSFGFEPNSLTAQTATLTFANGVATFALRDDRGTHQVRCGLNRWLTSESTFSPMPLKLVDTPVPGETKTRIAATGIWTGPNTFKMMWRYVETAHYDTVTCRFAADKTMAVSFERSLVKVQKMPEKRPVLMGKLEKAVGMN